VNQNCTRADLNRKTFFARGCVIKEKIETIIHREEVLGDVMVIEGICNNKKKKFVFKKGQQ
jgi:hypothetical protein